MPKPPDFNTEKVSQLKEYLIKPERTIKLKNGFITVLLNFHDEETLKKTLAVKDENTYKSIMTQFIRDMIYKYIGVAISTGGFGFDVKKPVFIKKLSFFPVEYNIVGGQALQLSCWFTQNYEPDIKSKNMEKLK